MNYVFRYVAVVFLGWGWTNGLVWGDDGNWPRFRGPNGTGLSPQEHVPVQWTSKDVVWSAEIPGSGNSSPIIWGDRLFLQSAADDGNERSLLCFNVNNGKLTWVRSIPASPSRKHPKNTLASATPATDGKRVYALFWDASGVSLAAYSFAGEIQWKRQLGQFAGQHGPGTSPIVYGGLVYIANDQDGASAVLALDSSTGKTVWESSRHAYRACYSTPCLLELPGLPPQLIVASSAGVTSYRPATGLQNWHWNWSFNGQPLRTVGSPVVGQGLIFATSGDGGGARHAVAVKPGSVGAAAEVAWENKRLLPYVPTVLAWGEHLYYVSDHGVAGCCNAATGENIWSERLGGNVTSSPVLIGGNIYVSAEDGTVYVFEAGPRFRLLGKSTVGEPVMATPAVAQNRLFIRGQHRLYCIASVQK
jgi:outer membrane protein assembly factor BamB